MKIFGGKSKEGDENARYYEIAKQAIFFRQRFFSFLYSHNKEVEEGIEDEIFVLS